MTPGFKLVRDISVIKTQFMFEGKIPNDSNVTVLTRNHTEDDDDVDDDATKNNRPMSPPVSGGGGDIIHEMLI